MVFLKKKVGLAFANLLRFISLFEILLKKVENKLNELGEKMSKGDISPKDFNVARRLSDVNLEDINDKIIKDK